MYIYIYIYHIIVESYIIIYIGLYIAVFNKELPSTRVNNLGLLDLDFQTLGAGSREDS